MISSANFTSLINEFGIKTCLNPNCICDFHIHIFLYFLRNQFISFLEKLKIALKSSQFTPCQLDPLKPRYSPELQPLIHCHTRPLWSAEGGL